jgi:hypothetical protein
MIARILFGMGLFALVATTVLGQDAKPVPTEPKAADGVVPYCIEPMDSMPENVVALIDPQFRCVSGTHLSRDSRPARVVPTHEESRPFVLRFGPPETANAWYVRGFNVER